MDAFTTKSVVQCSLINTVFLDEVKEEERKGIQTFESKQRKIMLFQVVKFLSRDVMNFVPLGPNPPKPWYCKARLPDVNQSGVPHLLVRS